MLFGDDALYPELSPRRSCPFLGGFLLGNILGNGRYLSAAWPHRESLNGHFCGLFTMFHS